MLSSTILSCLNTDAWVRAKSASFVFWCSFRSCSQLRICDRVTYSLHCLL
jgi:hypothetical protein